METTVAASSLCIYSKVCAVIPRSEPSHHGSLQEVWWMHESVPYSASPHAQKALKRHPNSPFLLSSSACKRQSLQMWKGICFSRWVTEEAESPWPGCQRCLEEQGGQPSPAPAASCRTEVLVAAMLPRESSAPGSSRACPLAQAWIPSPFWEVLTPTVLLSLSIIITSPSHYQMINGWIW